MITKRLRNNELTGIVFKSTFSAYTRIGDTYKLELFCPFDFTDRVVKLYNGKTKPLFKDLYILNALGFLYTVFMLLTYCLLMGFCFIINPISDLLEDYKDIRYKGMEFTCKVIWFLLAVFGVYKLIW